MEGEITLGICTVFGIFLILFGLKLNSKKNENKNDVKKVEHNNLTFIEGYFRHTINLQKSELIPTKPKEDINLLDFIEGFSTLDYEIISKAKSIFENGNMYESNELLSKSFYPHLGNIELFNLNFLTFHEQLLLVKLTYPSTPSNVIKRHIATSISGGVYVEKRRYGCIALQSGGYGISEFHEGDADLFLLRPDSYDIKFKDIIQERFVVQKIGTRLSFKNLGSHYQLNMIDLENILKIRNEVFSLFNVNKALGIAQTKFK